MNSLILFYRTCIEDFWTRTTVHSRRIRSFKMSRLSSTPPTAPIPLQTFLQKCSPPRQGRITDGFDVTQQSGIRSNSILTFRETDVTEVTLTLHRRGLHRPMSARVPIDHPGRFHLLPYDPVFGDPSPNQILRTVADLIRAFPIYVVCNLDCGVTGDPSRSLVRGDKLKLCRTVCIEDRECLECRRLDQWQLVTLAPHCIGNFTLLPDNNEYCLSEIVRLERRRRRLFPCPPQTKTSRDLNNNIEESNKTQDQDGGLQGLPFDRVLIQREGGLFIEIPDCYVEATTVDLKPEVTLGLPRDLRIMVLPEVTTNEPGQLLNTFANCNKNRFPFLVSISDWKEETTVLENHFVRPGVEIVLHGWTKQSKILAKSEDAFFAVPLTYQGRFRVRSRLFPGSEHLVNARPTGWVRVKSVDLSERLPISVGDVIKLSDNNINQSEKSDETPTHFYCDKKDGPQNIQVPVTSSASFLEILDESESVADPVLIRDLSSLLIDRDIEVELVVQSPDVTLMDRDLPIGIPILLTDPVAEQSVFASLDTPDTPAFHLPLRTLIYVKMIRQLDRQCSPLLTKQSPRLSTLDRCVERLPKDVFESLQPQQRSFESHDQHW